jgi:uncharacterized coiled-coil protein SlyX
MESLEDRLASVETSIEEIKESLEDRMESLEDRLASVETDIQEIKNALRILVIRGISG